jgi:hypothetical protein
MKKKQTSVSKKSNSVNKLNKQLMLVAVKYIAEKIVKEKGKNNGRVPWGYAAKLLKEGRETFPKMSMRTINNYIIKLEKEQENQIKIGSSIMFDSSNTNNVSNITEEVTSSDTSSNSGNKSISPSERSVSDSDHSDHSDNTSDESDTSDSETTTQTDPFIIKGGRPKGSTVARSLELQKNIEAATRESVEKLAELQKRMKQHGTRLQKGTIAATIEECSQKHNLPHSVKIKVGTVKQRLKRKSTKGTVGQCSPMEAIEPYIVSIIIQLANMRIPITVSQGLQLCNSIISGTRFKDQVAEFKKKNCRSVTEELGRGYWRGFLKRNKHLIASKKAVKFDTKRAEWCTYLNMQEMYEEVYTALVSAELAVKHETSYWRDAH